MSLISSILDSSNQKKWDKRFLKDPWTWTNNNNKSSFYDVLLFMLASWQVKAVSNKGLNCPPRSLSVVNDKTGTTDAINSHGELS